MMREAAREREMCDSAVRHSSSIAKITMLKDFHVKERMYAPSMTGTARMTLASKLKF